jgi:hypothetical protein
MKKFFFIIFITSCTSNNFDDNKVLDFNMDITLDEFKVLLEDYNKNKGYPAIDK